MVLRIGKWYGLLACLSLVAIYGLSMIWWLGWTGVRQTIGARVGVLTWAGGGPDGFANGWFAEPLDSRVDLRSLRYELQSPKVYLGPPGPSRYWSAKLPLWIPFSVVLPLTMICWYRVWRRSRPGLCSNCG